MKQLKIASLLGRGIEGAGVTRFADELDYYINNKTDHSIDTYALIDKKWGRASMQEHNFKEIDVKRTDLKDFTTKLNTYDIVIYNSIPAKKGFSEQYQQDFVNYIVRGVTTFKVGVQHDHKIHSLIRNYELWDTMKEMDVYVTHHKNSKFIQKMKEKIDPNIDDRTIEFSVPISFDRLERYRKSFSDKKRRVTYLGRYATFKDPGRLYPFHPYIRKFDFITELVGIERSIGALDKMFKFPGNVKDRHGVEMIDCTRKDVNVTPEQQTTELPYVYGPYVRSEGLENVSKSLFGVDFFNIIYENYKNLEYAHLEIIGASTIPLFDYGWGSNTQIQDGTKLTDIDNYGLFLKSDLSNAEEVASKMNEIANNPELAQLYIDTSYEVTKNSFDSKVTIDKLLTNIMNRL